MIVPHDTEDPFTEADIGWHLLSYGRKIRTSSVLDTEHTPDKAADENMKTWWSAVSGSGGEWLEMDLGKVYDVCALQINFADQDIRDTHGRGHGFSYRYLVEISEDGSCWKVLIDHRNSNNDLCHQYFQMETKKKFRYIRITNHDTIPAGGKFAISGLRVFGFGSGTLPESEPHFRALRCTDPRNVDICWNSVSGAEGYIIRFGVYPDELYNHWQVIGATSTNLGCLTAGVKYYITVDAYNENGIVYGKNILPI